MITITDYCTANSVRAVLGVSEEEIGDTVILDPIYAVQLQENLRDIVSGLVTAYAAIGVSPSSDEEHFKELVQTYAAYQLGQILLTSVRMFAPQTIMDSKSQMSRVSDPYADLRGEILGSLDYLILRVKLAYSVLYPAVSVTAAVAPVFAVTSGINFDPVLGV